MAASKSGLSQSNVMTLVDSYKKSGEEDDDDDDADANLPFVERTWFNSLVGLIIFANAVTIGLEANARTGLAEGAAEEGIWYVLELAFCILFAVELLLRLYFHGFSYFIIAQLRSSSSGWSAASCLSRLLFCCHPVQIKYANLIDLIIVLTSLLDTFILIPIGSGGDVRIVSMLRFVRLLRLVRLVRLFKIFKELWLVASGLLNALKTLVWLCVVIGIVCYVAGIGVTVLIGHNDQLYDPYFRESGWDHEIYFASTGRSMLTLVQIITLDSWSDGIVRHVARIQPNMRWLFLALICTCTLGLLNIIVGIVVENALSTAQKDERRLKKEQDKQRRTIFNQLQDIFEKADTDGSGTLDIDEVRNALASSEIYSKLRLIDFPVNNPQEIFHVLDYDDSGELPIDAFINGCLRMTGSAKSKDLLVAQVALDCMRRSFDEFEQEMESVQTKLNRLFATTRALTDSGETVLMDMQRYRIRHPEVQDASMLRRIQSILSRGKQPWEAGVYLEDGRRASAVPASEDYDEDEDEGSGPPAPDGAPSPLHPNAMQESPSRGSLLSRVRLPGILRSSAR